MLRERQARTLPGGLMVVLLFVLVVASVAGIVDAARGGWGTWGWTALVVLALSILASFGLFVVNPNEGKVVILFGNYAGTARRPGFFWMNPFCLRNRVSLRVRNFESAKLKVNDHVGNPIEIAAVVVWRVVDTAEAMFEVDDYKNFVQVQTEAALVRSASVMWRPSTRSTS